MSALVHELGTCVTEADLLQVLYRGLQGKFGYDAINLQVLEREGWYHSQPIDSGVLQDVRRRPVRESSYARQFANPKTTVLPIESTRQEFGKGPGGNVRSKMAIWVPVTHQGELIGSVIYHTYRKRRVPPMEQEFLEDVHRRLGVLLANASLNELTRNQARRLQALNGIARAMTSTLDESTVLTGLYGTLRELLPVDSLEMVTLPEDNERARYYRIEGDAAPAARWLPARSSLAATARTVIAGNKPAIAHDPHSSLWVALKEGGIARGALGIRCSRPYAYEDSTAAFLELVCDEVALALRNARSYEAIEDQRRRLEVVNSVGRRLASSLDRWSIMRTLREELSANLT
ncbi:MAG TPA: GAF domain-containing protein, partial [Candidatus Dormibacteraeota bacterium]|nr:GAF domain-containing protein [Candidatus Dormibacteraeota bacterium]